MCTCFVSLFIIEFFHVCEKSPPLNYQALEIKNSSTPLKYGNVVHKVSVMYIVKGHLLWLI